MQRGARKRRALAQAKKALADKEAAAAAGAAGGGSSGQVPPGSPGEGEVVTLTSPAAVGVSVSTPTPRTSRPRSVLSPVRVAPLDTVEGNLASRLSEEPLRTESMPDSKSFFPMSPFNDGAATKLAEMGFQETTEDTLVHNPQVARVQLYVTCAVYMCRVHVPCVLAHHHRSRVDLQGVLCVGGGGSWGGGGVRAGFGSWAFC
jgi:hypothetical protein